jgi:phospholipid-binding lipoprotein MlaA
MKAIFQNDESESLTGRGYFRKLSLVLVLLAFCLLPAFAYAEAADSPGAKEETAVKESDTGTADISGRDMAKTEGPAMEEEAGMEEIAPEESIPDPLEPWNRAMFAFNDKLYFWVMRPVSKGYNAVFPEPVRVSVNNFFTNLSTPVRFVNCLLQGQLKCAGIELARVAVNSSIGFGGLFDVAKYNWHMEKQDRDFGQTLGSYGIKDGFYIVWPFLGPSSLRDSVGRVGDGYLTPWEYITPYFYNAVGVDAAQYFNENALTIDDYKDFKESAIEPYVALRDAFFQHRKSLYKQQ